MSLSPSSQYIFSYTVKCYSKNINPIWKQYVYSILNSDLVLHWYLQIAVNSTPFRTDFPLMDVVPLALEIKDEGFKSTSLSVLFLPTEQKTGIGHTEGTRNTLKKPVGGSNCLAEWEKCYKGILEPSPEG